jgi:hypothetical protein
MAMKKAEAAGERLMRESKCPDCKGTGVRDNVQLDGSVRRGVCLICCGSGKLPPMVHPEDEPIVGAQIDGMSGEELEAYIEATAKSKPLVKELQSKADAVPAKKRGRPKVRSAEDDREYQREYKRKKRAAAKEGKS